MDGQPVNDVTLINDGQVYVASATNKFRSTNYGCAELPVIKAGKYVK